MKGGVILIVGSITNISMDLATALSHLDSLQSLYIELSDHYPEGEFFRTKVEEDYPVALHALEEQIVAVEAGGKYEEPKEFTYLKLLQRLKLPSANPSEQFHLAIANDNLPLVDLLLLSRPEGINLSLAIANAATSGFDDIIFRLFEEEEVTDRMFTDALIILIRCQHSSALRRVVQNPPERFRTILNTILESYIMRHTIERMIGVEQ